MSNNSVNSNSKYEVRAPPRRRAKKDDQEDQPIFLRKAYAMITSCPTEIGGWSEKGDTVVIKDVKAFSEKVIPTAYKHNNFSSFVRQLNFYGFRKVKSESLQNPNWWEFRHPSFVRGKPQLLSEIKRSMHFVPEGNNSGNVKEISELKSQVATLTERLTFLNDQVERLTGAFNDMHVAPLQVKSEKSKKRKPAADNFPPAPTPVLIENIELRRMNSLGSQTYVNEFKSSGAALPSGNDLVNFDWNEDDDDMMVEESDVKNLYNGEEEVLFHEICGDLAALAEKEDDEQVTPAPAIDEMVHNQSSDDMSRVSDSFSEVSSVIDKLPAELQLRFVDKLAEVVGFQLASAMNSQSGVPVVKAELVEEQPKMIQNSPYPEYVLPSGNKAPEIALPLASAAISAFLMSNFRTLTQGMPHTPDRKSVV